MKLIEGKGRSLFGRGGGSFSLRKLIIMIIIFLILKKVWRL